MKLESINCNHCGAPLEVAEKARFVTCRHCETKLAVRRTSSAAFTEEIDRLSETTDRLSDQLAQISYDNAVERLDREWEQERKRYMVRGKHGREYTPSVGNAVAVAAVGGFIGLIGLNMGHGGGWMFGLFAFGVAFIGAASIYYKAGQYTQAQKRYSRRRRSLNVDQFKHNEDDELSTKSSSN